MKSEKFKWHFLKFLLEAKVYKTFIDNVEVNDNPFRRVYGVESLKTLFDKFSPKNWVAYGFEWSKTKEGHEFWRKVHVEWKDNVNDLDKL